jgi:polyhydroxyalkanoate synthesis regulator phasin
MLKEVKESLLTGLGAVLLTKEKVEEVIRKLSEETNLSEAEAQKLRDELLTTGTREFEKLENAVSESFRSSFENMGLVRQEAFQELREKVDAMEVRLSLLEKFRQDAENNA